MNREGTIDAILTEDVDAFLFGAETIIRMYVSCFSLYAIPYQCSPDSVNFKEDRFKMYRARDCARKADVHLSMEDMIVVALLSGGDYDKVGTFT